MKLNEAEVQRTLSQFEARVVPESHPVATHLSEVFGPHTFFIDSSGVNVLEPAAAPDAGARRGEIVNLAYWSDGTFTALNAHEPEPTGVLVMLEPEPH
ncbi:hypothetical protein X566_17810 [Afipia sp. P52-10]|uniref:hypothetical protein n=1 Tax=Afipia sp. P52-10 TaxID=1429916 RepID=UPI0003DF2148|nr:hypothetical protein [Afipia sp. P52-10]ETR76384.1 hypothetical protein X566_17810 [Afipia sp. P52-10]